MPILKWSVVLALALPLAAACGEVPTQGDDDDVVDAGPGEDGGGGGPDATAFGFATIITVIDGVPRPGVPVIFHDENGDVSDRLVSDAEGRATAEVHQHAMATALILRPDNGSGSQDHLLLTVTDLNPGDEVQVGPRVPKPDYTPLTTVTINPPGAFPGASYYDYRAGPSCSNGSPDATPMTLDLSRSCVDPLSRFAILVIARADDNTAIAYSTLNGTWSGTPAMTVTMPPWRTEFRTVNVTTFNAPPQSLFVSSGIELWQNNVSFSMDETQVGVTAGGSGDMRLLYPEMFGSRFAVTTFLGLGADNALDGISLLYQRFSNLPLDLEAIDLGTFLPKISSGMTTAVGPRPSVAWSEDSGSQADAGADGGLVVVSWNLSDPAGNYLRYQWVATIRPDAPTSFTFPALLDDDTMWVPPDLPIAFDQPQVIYLDADTSDDYPSFRSLGLSTMIDNGPPDEVGRAYATFAGGF